VSQVPGCNSTHATFVLRLLNSIDIVFVSWFNAAFDALHTNERVSAIGSEFKVANQSPCLMCSSALSLFLHDLHAILHIHIFSRQETWIVLLCMCSEELQTYAMHKNRALAFC
jgi:hypothetical protein